MSRRFISLAFCVLFVPTAAAETVRLATLDWPPYTGGKLPAFGATSEIITQAFAKMETKTEIVVRPWKRAIAEAQNGRAAGYFPGYHCRHVEGFIASDPVGTGPLGFAEHAERPIQWRSIDDLGEQKLKIGTVLGYVNTDEFDRKVGSGWIRAITAKDDLTNLKKLARKRIDAAVIDKFVLAYMLAVESSLKPYADKIKFNAKPLEEKRLHLCVTSEPLRDAFNAALKKVDIDQILTDYFKRDF
ncbi:MAG: ABC transporter substrate-binding protein [Pseudomonadota bacterium]